MWCSQCNYIALALAFENEIKYEDIEYLTFVQPFAVIEEQDLALLDAGKVKTFSFLGCM